MTYRFTLERCPICTGAPNGLTFVSEGVAQLVPTERGGWELFADPDMPIEYTRHEVRQDPDRPGQCLLTCEDCAHEWWSPYKETGETP